jgi:hypothetical protein
MRGISRVAYDLLASQEGLCPTELVRVTEMLAAKRKKNKALIETLSHDLEVFGLLAHLRAFTITVSMQSRNIVLTQRTLLKV